MAVSVILAFLALSLVLTRVRFVGVQESLDGFVARTLQGAMSARRVIPGLHNSAEEPSMEGRNLLAPSQVCYLEGESATGLRLRCSPDMMRIDRAVE